MYSLMRLGYLSSQDVLRKKSINGTKKIIQIRNSQLLTLKKISHSVLVLDKKYL